MLEVAVTTFSFVMESVDRQLATVQPRDNRGRFHSSRPPRKAITLRIDPNLEDLIGTKNLRQWITDAINEKLERETIDNTANTR